MEELQGVRRPSRTFLPSPAKHKHLDSLQTKLRCTLLLGNVAVNSVLPTSLVTGIRETGATKMTRRQALSILTADIASGLVGFLAPISAWKYLIIFGKIGSSLETYDGVFLKSQKFLNVFF